MSARRGGRYGGGGGGGQKRPYRDNYYHHDNSPQFQDYRPQSSSSTTSNNDLNKEPKDERKRTNIVDKRYCRKTEEFIAFDSRFVKALLSNVKVLTIGDSLMRGLYKDLITWLNTDDLTSDWDIKARAESSYKGDRQIDVSFLSDDKVFRQAREYQTEHHLLQFFFTTRVMKDDMERLIQQMLGDDGYPDVILLNSMIWDLTRYFKVSTDMSYADNYSQKKTDIETLQKYLDRTAMLLRRFRAILPPHTMVVWIIFPHCRPSISMGGRGIQSMPLTDERNHFIRGVMIDGSFRVAQLVRNAGYDVLDLDFYMHNHAFYHYQKEDGMHWQPSGVRLMSQLVMQFLAKSWGVDTSLMLERFERSLRNNKLKFNAMEVAMKQFTDYDYYSENIPKIQDDIAQTTYNDMAPEKRYEINEILEKGRTLTPFVQPTRKERRRVHSFRNPNSTEYADYVQLAPRIDIQTTRNVERLAREFRNLLS